MEQIVSELYACTYVCMYVGYSYVCKVTIHNYFLLDSNDYEEVFISLVFNASSNNTQCLNVIILDDEIFELQEGFSLMLEPSLPSIRIGSNASVFILDNESNLSHIRTPFCFL